MSTTTRLVRAATLEGFTEEVRSADGVSLSDLEPLTTLLVRTRNSDYRITVSEGTAVLVQGGRFFPEATAAHLDGASFGGSLIEVGWIRLGLRMELRSDARRIVTSPVRAIVTERQASARVH